MAPLPVAPRLVLLQLLPVREPGAAIEPDGLADLRLPIRVRRSIGFSTNSEPTCQV